MILAERAARLEAEAKLPMPGRTPASTDRLLQAGDREAERQLYGTRSERKARLLEQMELQLEELEATATEDELAAEKAAARTQSVQSFQRRRPARKPFPEHLPRERIVIPSRSAAPAAVRRSCRSSAKTSPRRWR